VCSFASCITGRFDTLKISVAYAQANLRVVGSHGGIAIGEDGYSQQGLEDLSAARSLPGMAVLNPADDLETEAAVEYLCTHSGPVYLRTTRQKVERVNPDGYRFQFGKAVELRRGDDAVIFATGGEVHPALQAASSLSNAGINVGVINIHTLKPLDSTAVVAAARKVKLVATAEDHQIIGGLGSAVAEALADAAVGVRLLRIGIPDTFGESGSPEELLAKYKLDARGIAERVRAALQ